MKKNKHLSFNTRATTDNLLPSIIIYKIYLNKQKQRISLNKQ